MPRGKLVRNSDGIWINTDAFRQKAKFFEKYGYYNSDPTDTPAWIKFWNDERELSLNGMRVGGVKITGDHYFYLNYKRIKKAVGEQGYAAKKIEGFPDFWDGDYDYYWSREIARNGVFSHIDSSSHIKRLKNLAKTDREKFYKKLEDEFDKLRLRVKIKGKYLVGGEFDIVVGKSRRKGYSYKAAGIAAKNWALLPKSLTMLVAYSNDYLLQGGLYTKTRDTISFLREHTAWGHPSDVVDSNSKGHIKASYWETIDGRKIEKGFLSEIFTVTYGQKSDVTRGYDAYDVFFEESGAAGSPGRLKDTLAATYDTVRAGALKTGLITIFGTSGNPDNDSADYGEILLNPRGFRILPFQNIWDKDAINTEVGFFHPVNWNMEGFYDESGNSDAEGAKKHELAIRKSMKEGGATNVAIKKRMMEQPLTPLEAFGTSVNNIFPTLELEMQLRKVRAKNLFRLKGTPINMYYSDGELKVEPVLNDKVVPIDSFRALPEDTSGIPVIYEFPIEGAPRNSYKIGYDPVAQDEGTSLASIVVYKSVVKGSHTHNILVAEYIGRKNMAQDVDRIAEKFADLYNSQVMHENMDKGTRTYFRRIKRLHLLAAQPDAVINNSVKNSRVARVFGCHMNDQLKAAGERYIAEWLNMILDYDEFGNAIHTYDRIYSPRMLEELIAYNRNGNFDMVMSLMMALFMVQEEELPSLGKAKDSSDERFEELDSLLDEDY